MSDHDISIDEKRVYDARSGTEVVLLATDRGLAAVSVSADRIGEFALLTTAPAIDVAVVGERVALAGEDVRLLEAAALDGTGDVDAVDTGFGRAVAVSDADGELVAVGADGRVAALDGDAWVERGRAPDPRRADGSLIAAADGVLRVGADGVTPAGLEDAHDVADGTDRGPWAATASGVYRLGNGWLAERDGDATAVTARDDRVAAAVEGALCESDGDWWTDRDVPLDDVAAVGYGRSALYAADAAGTLAVDVGDGWRTRAIGLPGVNALCVVADGNA